MTELMELIRLVGMKFDPHGYAKKLKTYIKGIESGKWNINPENKKLLLDYYRHIISKGFSIPRIYKHMETIVQIAKMTKDCFGTLSKDQIRDMVIEIETRNLSEWTKHDYKVVLRIFYKWLKGNDQKFPDEVSWISIHVKERYKLPEELLTEEEIKKMAEITTNPRDRALIQLLFETGCRIGKLLTLQLKNIQFDDFGAVLRVTGKTGTRRVRVVASVPSISAWLNFHPFKNDPESYFFLSSCKLQNNNRNPFTYHQAFNNIRTAAILAGIKKRVHPHLFRHSRATVLANKLTEAQMKEYFGWTQGSDMASIYVHLSGRDVDEAILKVHGIKGTEKLEENKFATITCTKCGVQNAPDSKFCTRCGFAFSPDLAVKNEPVKQDNLLAQFMKDPEVRELLLKKMTEMTLKV